MLVVRQVYFSLDQVCLKLIDIPVPESVWNARRILVKRVRNFF